ncbi:TPA: winged helix-turn-helix transcriptional regulator [Listeria monocytogenes]
MEQKSNKEIRCPLEYGLEMFGGKWKSRILCTLFLKKKLRYREIKESLVDITDPVLSKALKDLQHDGLIEREQFNEMPIRVEYKLSDKGSSIIPILIQIYTWSEEYINDSQSN